MSLMQLVTGGLIYKAKETVTVTTASIGLTTATIGRNDQALITVEDAAVRYWLNGEAPSATVGHILEEGGALLIQNRTTLHNVRFYSREGIDATLQVSFGV
jgi:hypothetical protein